MAVEALPPSRPARRGVPAELTSFVGRERDVSEVKRLVRNNRLVTVSGAGGIGKTRLATRVARDLDDELPGDVLFVDLTTSSTGDLIAESIMSALDLRGTVGPWPTLTLAEHLAGRQVLIVLDNCEHLRDACAMLVSSLLEQAPGLRLLTTSRQTLGVPGEHVHRLAPLSMPRDQAALSPSTVDRYEAVDLFAQRARAVRSGLELTGETLQQVAELCARLDGIPLAIELAAARVSALSVGDVLDRMTERRDLVTASSPARAPRHQNLRDLVAWSWDLCTPDEQRIWAWASVFRGGFDLEALEAVCGADAPDGTVLTGLGALVDKSIVTVVDEQDTGRVRYRLLETLRSFAEEKLQHTGDDAAAREAHRTYYAAAARTAELNWFGADQDICLGRLRLEHSNFRAALRTSFGEGGDAAAGLAIVSSLWFYWIATGQTGEARRWFALGLGLDRASTTGRCRALEMYAYLCLQQEDLATALPLVEEADVMARAADDPVGLAWATQLRGMVRLCSGDLAAAEKLFLDALVEHETNGDVIAAVDTTFFLASVCALTGRPDRAEQLYGTAIATSESRGERWTKEYMLWGLAFVAWKRQDLDQARDHARRALRLARELDETWTVAFCVELLSWIAEAGRDAAHAATLSGAAEEIWRRLGWRHVGLPLYYGIQDLTADHDRCIEALRTQLGETRFLAAGRQGREMPIGSAISYALGESPRSPDRHSVTGFPSLTRREAEVVELIAAGLSNKQIAARLTIAQRTAEAHVERILSKLGFASRARVAAWVVEHRGAESQGGSPTGASRPGPHPVTGVSPARR